MIFCKLDRLDRYRGQSAHLDTALDFLSRKDLKALPMGQTVIDGENVFINRFDYDTTAAPLTEWHDRYIDIHLVLDGEEQVGVLEAGGLQAEDPQSEDHTCQVEAFESMTTLRPGYALITFPEDAHCPRRICQTPCHVQKVVIKVLDR